VSRSQLWGRGLAACLLAVPLGWLASGSAPLRAAPSEAEEEANCARVNQFVEANAAPALEALDRLARQRYGRGFTELTPEQVEVVARGSTVSGRQMTAEQERLRERCAAYQRRVIARQSATRGITSLFGSQGLLDRWGRERVGGLGCECPDFRPAGEEVDHGCAGPPSCPGQQGGPRMPDPERGCRAIGAALWIRQQLPDFYTLLGEPSDSEPRRDVIAARDRRLPTPGCASLPVPNAAPLSVASVTAGAAAAPAGPVAPAAIEAAARCFAAPAPEACQAALRQGDALVLAAKRAGRDRCLGYGLSARGVWALGADPRFTDLLIRFPEASRLRNEARIALRYLRADCRGL